MVLPNRKVVFLWNMNRDTITKVKYALICVRQSFLKEPPKDDYEEYARKVIDRAYFIILNKIDELDGTNERLLEEYKNILKKQ